MPELSPKVIFETSDFYALSKPSGWVVNDSVTSHGNPTLQDWVSENLNTEISKNTDLRNGIIHRLDKETSGVILVAKTLKSLEALQAKFKNREVQKVYVALVHGELKGGGEINAKIGRNPLNRTHFTVLPEGRKALTQYKVLKNFKYKNEKLTLLELYPKTGRTHQLRVHLKHIGHPIVSDPLYVGRKTLRSDLLFCPRLFLHAKSLEISGHKIECPLPSDLESAINLLQ